jgi:hypothetical protein
MVKNINGNRKVREIMRPGFVTAYPGDNMDDVAQQMVIFNAENIIVVDGVDSRKPTGTLSLWKAPTRQKGSHADGIGENAASAALSGQTRGDQV